MIITQRRNLIQRGLNRLLHPFGIKPFPIAFESTLPEAGSNPQSIFDAVYAANYWDSAESKSGPGSELITTERYRKQLVALLRELRIKSMFDAPCGDLNWMSEVLKEVPLRYIGGDIATESYQDIYRALTMARSSKIKFAAITTHKAIMLRNMDIKTGGGRLLDLERPPFNFPKALRYLRDSRFGEFPRYVGIWRVSDIPAQPTP
jgi:hypothetical protein